MAKLFHAGVLLLALVLSSASPQADVGGVYERVRVSLKPFLVERGEIISLCTATAVGPRQYITANHCIEEMDYGALMFDESIPVTVLRRDKSKDIALLLSEEETFPPALQLGEEPRFGEDVITIGYHMGSNPPASFFGKVMGGEFPQIGKRLLIDASGNVGSSGGAVVNKEGKLVGMVQGGINPPSIVTYGATLKTIKEFLR